MSFWTHGSRSGLSAGGMEAERWSPYTLHARYVLPELLGPASTIISFDRSTSASRRGPRFCARKNMRGPGRGCWVEGRGAYSASERPGKRGASATAEQVVELRRERSVELA